MRCRAVILFTAAATVAAVTALPVAAAAAAGTASIAGTVSADAGGAALGAVHVALYRPSGDYVKSQYTKSDGSYAFTALTATSGGYVVCFDGTTSSQGPSPSGYQSECYDDVPWDNAGLPGGVARLHPSDGTTVTADAGLASGGAIAGKVTSDATGKPVTFAGVHVLDDSGNQLADDFTSSSGVYSVRGLPVSSDGYVVCFDGSDASGGGVSSGYASECYRDVAWDGSYPPPSGTTRVPVTAGVTATLNAGLASGAAIAGRVIDAQLTGLGDVQVYVETALGDVVTTAETDADGKYRITGLTADSSGYVVCFDASQASGSSTTGYLSQCYSKVPWDGQNDVPSGVTPVTTTAGATHSGINATLTRAGAVSGVVTDSHGAAIPDATAYVFDPTNRDIIGGTGTGDDGSFTIASLPASTHYLVCVDTGDLPAPGYAPQCYRNTVWDGSFDHYPATATRISVRGGQTTSVGTFALADGGAISGTITSAATGAGLTLQGVLLFDGSGLLDEHQTAHDGSYAFRNLSPAAGPYTLCVTSGTASQSAPTGYASQCYDDVPWNEDFAKLPGGTTPIQLQPGTITQHIDAAMKPGAALSGKVTAAGAGIDNALINVYAGSDPIFETATSSTGAYRINNLTPGTYTVCFDASIAGPYIDQCWKNQVWDGTNNLPPGATPVTLSAGHVTSGISAAVKHT